MQIYTATTTVALMNQIEVATDRISDYQARMLY